MKEFWERGVIPRGGNPPFIALIPKRDDPQGLDE